MPHVLSMSGIRQAQDDIAWLASAAGFTANSISTLPRWSEIAKAVLELISTVVRNPDRAVDPELRWMAPHVPACSMIALIVRRAPFENDADEGVSQEKLDAIWEFETSPVFSSAERVALKVALTGGQCPSYANSRHG